MTNLTKTGTHQNEPARSLPSRSMTTRPINRNDVSPRQHENNQIDLEELMRALKQERTTKNVLDKDGHRRKNLAECQSGSEVVSDNNPDDHSDDSGKIEPEYSATERGAPVESGAIDTDGGGMGRGEGGEPSSQAEEQTSEVAAAVVVQGQQQQQQQDSKEERPLFSPEEAESLTSYLVESQQAFSLLNVADIQRGEV